MSEKKSFIPAKAEKAEAKVNPSPKPKAKTKKKPKTETQVASSASTMSKAKVGAESKSAPKKKAFEKVDKTELHPRSKHTGNYNFEALVGICPDLKEFIIENKFGAPTIDFSVRDGVRMLNKAILALHYKIPHWNVPLNYLVPPIPGRVDYIHYLADLLGESGNGAIPKGPKISGLDVGTGASMIYPLLGFREYGWSFVGVDIDLVSITSAQEIVKDNELPKKSFQLRLQKNEKDYFFGAITREEKYDFTMCNPPFHSSLGDAEKGNVRKWANLKGRRKTVEYNFGGRTNELWTEGGERQFVLDMIEESQYYGETCFWFTTLVSKQSNLKGIYQKLDGVNAKDVQTVDMGQGNKVSRVVAWTFLSKKQRKEWVAERWK